MSYIRRQVIDIGQYIVDQRHRPAGCHRIRCEQSTVHKDVCRLPG